MTHPKLAKTHAQRFGVTAPEFITETAAALIWKVQRRDGAPAALKIYRRGDMGNEAAGFTFMAAQDGVAAAQIFETTPDAALSEWLAGPSLGDLSRAGRDKEAAQELVGIANMIHADPVIAVAGLHPLETWFASLKNLETGPSCPKALCRNLQFAKSLARDLCGSQQDIRPLHGDLHHDNIRDSARGFLAFDAKGLLGERSYELANAFRNPKGAPDLIRDPDRIRFLRDLWSVEFGVCANRLMQWAVAKTALSIVWRSDQNFESDPEADLLNILVGLLPESKIE